MDRILIRGGNRLEGKVQISGAKNAALPLMAAGLLSSEPLTLENVPHLADITTMANLLNQHGAALEVQNQKNAFGQTLLIDTPKISDITAPYDLVRKMRASILVLGPLLARCGEAKVSLPGGCAIGTRPVDLHIRALEELGAEIELEGGYIHAKAPKGLQGGHVVFPKVSVGATENLLMAAVLAKGDTVLMNVAREPEITDLAKCLCAMGAKIEGIGTDRLHVQGVSSLHGATHTVISDRIEAGTFMMAALATKGDLTLEKAPVKALEAVIKTLAEVGGEISCQGDQIKISGKSIAGVDVMTEPYPGFPTDLQAQFMALMSAAEGAAMITESIFENRFMHVPELMRMGADITIHGRSALVRGVKVLTGAPVMATDLRASVSMVIAGLIAKGQTEISRVYHLDRGYERLEEKLRNCGADIQRMA